MATRNTKNAKDEKMEKLEFGFSARLIAAAAVVAAFFATGCRRTDVRDFEVSIPALTAEAEPAIRQSLAGFAGVEKASLKFDAANHRVTMRYDSMQVAHKNIELAIAKAGWTANGATPESVGAKAK